MAVARAGRPVEVLGHVPHGDPLDVDHVTEDGTAVAARAVLYQLS